MEDVIREIGAVIREVQSREQDGEPVRVVVATRTYGATVEDLWDALTNAERIPRWFLPIAGELRPGGHYQFQGNAGGRITRCEPPRLVAVTWEFGGGISWVAVKLSPDPGGARLELEHIVPVDDHWERFGPGAVGVGWEMALMSLGRHLATGASADPASAAAWSASEAGKAFMRASGEDWGRAAIADGADPHWARAAAARTTAFYLGEPPAES